jgi:hypothetical protein
MWALHKVLCGCSAVAAVCAYARTKMQALLLLLLLLAPVHTQQRKHCCFLLLL